MSATLNRNLIIDPRIIARIEEKAGVPNIIQPLKNSSKTLDKEINRIRNLKFDPINAIHEARDINKRIQISATKQSLDMDPKERQYIGLTRNQDAITKAPRAKISTSKEYQQLKLLKPELDFGQFPMTRKEDESITPKLPPRKTMNRPSLQFTSPEAVLERGQYLVLSHLNQI
jgi:hypothetical protein